MHAQASERAEFEKVAAGVDEARHAFARQQLATRFEFLAFAFAFAHDLCLQRHHFGQALRHAFGVGGEGR